MTDDRDVEVNYELAAFIAELRRLADALESGADYAIDIDGETVTLPVDAMLSVAHEIDGDEAELEFQLTWSINEEADADAEEADDVTEDTATESEETSPA